MYSFGAMLSFTIAHISVIRLRQRQPERDAAVEAAAQLPMPSAFEVPLTAVLGGLRDVRRVDRRAWRSTR